MRSLAHQICAFRDFLCGQISSGSCPRLAITMILLTDMAKMEIADSACYRHALTRAWRAAATCRRSLMTEESAFLSQARSWDAFYAQAQVAEFRRRLYLETFGEEYPADEATDGYITRSELPEMVGALHVAAGHKIADLAFARPRPT